MSERASALPVLSLVAVVAAGHLSLFPRVADLDGFYHIGHALAYLEGSLFDTSLPWATRSIIGDTGGDLWWGFHVLLLPFAAAGGVEWGARSAAFALTLALGLVAYRVLARHGVRGAGWWAALLLVAVPNIFFRYLMLRPHVLSLSASIALLSVLVRGRWWQVALLSGAIAWVHLSLSWVGPAIAVVYSLARIVVTVGTPNDGTGEGVPLRLATPAAVLGAGLGWVLRPDPLATLSLLNVQLVELFALKALDVQLTFASELAPIGPVELLGTSWLFAAAWLVAGALLARARSVLGREQAILLVAAAALSVAFLALALLSARRAMEQWVGFGFLLVPFAWRVAADAWPRLGTRLAIVLVAAHLGWGAWRHSRNLSMVAFPGDTLAEPARFLEAASEPGDVVFHAHWDNFGPLFAHNRTNRYLGGMDPVFLYAHDSASYWEFFFLSADATTEYTCDAFPCSDGIATNTHRAMTDHFGARWVVVEPFRNPRLSLYLLDDPRYELAFETQSAAVFEILPDAGG